MFDAKLRPLIDPPLNTLGRNLAALGIAADAVTLAGLSLGIGAGFAIANDAYFVALALILANRILDGLDGAIARATRQTDFGGYLDIVADFAFYVAVPVGFGLGTTANTAAALTLVAAFTLTGISFMAFATMAAKRGLETTAHGLKSFYFNTGLAEGGETIAVFILMCLWPAWFNVLALIYAAACLVTILQRSLLARHLFVD